MVQRLEEKILLELDGGRVASMFVRIWRPDGEARGTVFCIHGYTGNGSDFDYLAQFLVRLGYAVVCPDMLGRGKSSYLRDSSQYSFELFVRAIAALGRYASDDNVFIGTSWGATIVLLFLRMTSTRCSKLVLNDVCLRSGDDLETMRDTIFGDSAQSFADQQEASAYLLKTRPYLADLPEERVADYLQNKLVEDGARLRLAYDPELPASMAAHRRRAFDFYPLIEKTHTPTLLLYGKDSPLGDKARLRAISQINPAVQYVADIPAGHPPSLMTLNEALLVTGYVALSDGSA